MHGLCFYAIWQIVRPGKSGMLDCCCACDAQILDVEGSIEKLGFDPLDDTKVRVVNFSSHFIKLSLSKYAEDEVVGSHADVCYCQKQRLLPSC